MRISDWISDVCSSDRFAEAVHLLLYRSVEPGAAALDILDAAIEEQMHRFGEAPRGGKRIGLGEQCARRAGLGLSHEIGFVVTARLTAKAQIVDPLGEGGEQMVEEEQQEIGRAHV